MPVSIGSISNRESCGMRHYSKSDAARLGAQHKHLVHMHQSNNAGAFKSGSGFQAAKGMKTGSILYKTTNDRMSKKLAVLHNKPDWNNQNPKSNAFSTGFHSMMYENTSLGSSMDKKTRKELGT